MTDFRARLADTSIRTLAELRAAAARQTAEWAYFHDVLKTFRLSESQVRRGYLLSRLAAHNWHLAHTAAALGME